MKLVISKALEDESLGKEQRVRLKGLTAHDIWALDSFSRGKKRENRINEMNPASKVMAQSLIEAGILEKKGEQVVPTKLGKEILEAANSISI